MIYKDEIRRHLKKLKDIKYSLKHDKPLKYYEKGRKTKEGNRNSHKRKK